MLVPAPLSRCSVVKSELIAPPSVAGFTLFKVESLCDCEGERPAGCFHMLRAVTPLVALPCYLFGIHKPASRRVAVFLTNKARGHKRNRVLEITV